MYVKINCKEDIYLNKLLQIVHYIYVDTLRKNNFDAYTSTQTLKHSYIHANTLIYIHACHVHTHAHTHALAHMHIGAYLRI